MSTSTTKKPTPPGKCTPTPTTFIGVRKGALDEENYKLFMDKKPFVFSGSPNDFVVLPK